MSEPNRGRGFARGRGNIQKPQPDAAAARADRSYETEEVVPKRFPSAVADVRPSAPIQSIGRATQYRTADPAAARAVDGAGAHAGTVERGAMRGRRQIFDLVHTRPATLATKQGTSGTNIKVLSNYFRLLKKPEWALYQYHVSYAPDVEINAVRKGLLRDHTKKLGGNIFDGTSLFLTNRLPNDTTEFFSKNRLDETIRITVKFTVLVTMAEGRAVQILNIIMRKALEGLKLQLVGRNFFDPKAKITIREHNLELWPGYVTSIRQHEQDILLCSEISHKVMRTDTMHHLLSSITQNSRGNFKEAFMKAVIGSTVLTDYNNKFYRVDDVNWEIRPSSTFDTKEGPKSFVDYYQQKYNIKIRDPHQPMLISKAKERDIRGGKAETIALVPELCRATGITDEMRANFQLMKAMGEFTRVGPDTRIRKLKEFNNRLYSSPESLAVFQEWQMQLDKNLVEINARELKNEIIVFANQSKVPSDRNADWTAQFRGAHKLYNMEPLKRWFCIFLERNANEAREFTSVLQQAAGSLGFQIEKPRPMSIGDDRPQTYISAVEKCLESDPQLIMLISPNNRADRYSAIKKKCCVERGIPSQVMLAKTVTPKKGANARSLMSVATKVAIQLSCKLGFSPWSIEMPLNGVMTIGFDVCHDSSDKSKSYGALVACMDIKLQNKYYSTVSAHRNGEELSNELTTNVSKALRAFRDIHGCLPAKIIFYRDGVGEGQLQYVVEHEIAQVKAKLATIYNSSGDESKLSFGFIVVNKRINARFFKGAVNPAPGTIVDDTVTSPESYDFFLVSQCVRQGTVSPTYYNVITENLGLPADKIQMYTYKMCHLYYNWSGTTRVPAVCQYAHKLAFLIGQSIHVAPSNALENKLYFL